MNTSHAWKASPRSRRLRQSLAVLTLTAVAAAAAWFYVLGPRPPDPQLAGAGPGVADDIAEVRRHVQWMPFSAQAWGNLGLLLHFYEYLPEAQACYRRAAELDRRSPRWPYLQAMVQMHSDIEGSVALLSRAAELGGTARQPRLLLGEILLLSGRDDEARGLFQAVLARDPENARALLGLGRVQSAKGELPAARATFERATRAEPRLRLARVLVAETLFKLGDEKGAERERLAAEKLPESEWPDPYRQVSVQALRGEAADVYRSTALVRSGRPEDALALLRAARLMYPRSGKVIRALGRTYAALDQNVAAEAAYKEAARLEPDSAETQFEWGILLQQLGILGDAMEAFSRTIKLRPEFGSAHFHLGQCLEQLDREADAEREYRAAVRYQPNLVDAHRALAALLIKSKRDAEAEIVLRDVVNLAPSDRASVRMLAEVRARLRK